MSNPVRPTEIKVVENDTNLTMKELCKLTLKHAKRNELFLDLLFLQGQFYIHNKKIRGTGACFSPFLNFPYPKIKR